MCWSFRSSLFDSSLAVVFCPILVQSIFLEEQSCMNHRSGESRRVEFDADRCPISQRPIQDRSNPRSRLRLNQQTLQQRFHYPYRFVSTQLTNSKGDKIFYPVNDDRDRQWARRLEFAIDRHWEIAEDDIEDLNDDYYSAVLRDSKEAHERKYNQAYHLVSPSLKKGLRLPTRPCASKMDKT